MGFPVCVAYNSKSYVQRRIRFDDTGNGKGALYCFRVLGFDLQIQSHLLPCFCLHPQELHGYLIHQDLVRRFRDFSFQNLDKTVGIVILGNVPQFRMAFQKFWIGNGFRHKHAVGCFLNGGIFA